MAIRFEIVLLSELLMSDKVVCSGGGDVDVGNAADDNCRGGEAAADDGCFLVID